MAENTEFRIFITGSGIVDDALRKLENENCRCEIGTPKDSAEDIAAKLTVFNPDALIVRQGKITREVLASAPGLKVICKHGVGTDNIDIAASTQAGIPVFFTPNANFEAVASHTLALILSLLRQIPMQDRRVKHGIFDKAAYSGLELNGKTLGLIGFGRVARRLTELVAPFRMRVLTYHPSGTDEELPNHITKVDDVDSVLRQADVVSLHCPLNSQTRYMLDKQAFHLMKSSAYLVNTARGGIVDERDLLTALKRQQISGAALDVLETEPPAIDHPLFQNENIIITPHIAGSSDQSLKNMGLAAADHVLAVLKRKPVDRASLKNQDVVLR